jgi:hypothetical protein
MRNSIESMVTDVNDELDTIIRNVEKVSKSNIQFVDAQGLTRLINHLESESKRLDKSIGKLKSFQRKLP